MSLLIRPRRLENASHTRNAIKGLNASRNATEIKSFLGLCNVLRHFVPSFARNVSPLSDKLRTTQPFNFVLKEQERNAMKGMQQKLISAPELALSYVEGRVPLDTDAYDIQFGCVLMLE